MEKAKLIPEINPFVRFYAEKLGGLAINAARVIAHEINPPMPEGKPANITHYGAEVADASQVS